MRNYYRIYFYDCKPLSKKVNYFISKTALDLSQTQTFRYRDELHRELIKKPCFALRMGYLDEKNGEWKFKNPSIMKDLLDNKIAISDLKDEHFIYYAKQKGVDMKIGIDIARLSFQKIVEKIVLISGDSDFVPAAKLTRTEGLHFTLDPMGNNIKSDLQEHIDWLHTTLPNH